MTDLNVLIAEDEVLFAKLMEEYVNKIDGVRVVSVVDNGAEAKKMLHLKPIDIALLDVKMPKIDGMQVLKFIRNEYPKVKVIMVSGQIDQDTINKALKLKANGFVSKFVEADEIINAVRTVLNGDCFLCKRCLTSITGPKQKKVEESTYGKLITKREIQILKLIAEGKKNPEIATILKISRRTVETHRRNILKKTGEVNFYAVVSNLKLK